MVDSAPAGVEHEALSACSCWPAPGVLETVAIVEVPWGLSRLKLASQVKLTDVIEAEGRLDPRWRVTVITLVRPAFLRFELVQRDPAWDYRQSRGYGYARTRTTFHGTDHWIRVLEDSSHWDWMRNG